MNRLFCLPTEGLPAHHRLKAVGSFARLKAPEARHERLIPSP
jgi:hypothetical protein